VLFELVRGRPLPSVDIAYNVSKGSMEPPKLAVDVLEGGVLGPANLSTHYEISRYLTIKNQLVAFHCEYVIREVTA
jgi:hypothetical protein